MVLDYRDLDAELLQKTIDQLESLKENQIVIAKILSKILFSKNRADRGYNPEFLDDKDTNQLIARMYALSKEFKKTEKILLQAMIILKENINQ